MPEDLAWRPEWITPNVQLASLDYVLHEWSEQALAGAPAKSRAIDEQFCDAKVRDGGRLPGLRALEADWVVTAEAVYYVAPRIFMALRLPWPTVGLLRVSASRRSRSLVVIGYLGVNGEPNMVEMETGRKAGGYLAEIGGALIKP